MAIKKKLQKPAAPRPDKRSRKRSGTVAMTLRVPVTDARLIRRASEEQGVSAHYWMLTHLLTLAQKQLGL